MSEHLSLSTINQKQIMNCAKKSTGKDILAPISSLVSKPLSHYTPQIMFCNSLSPPTLPIIYFTPVLVTITLGRSLTCKLRAAW